MKVRYLSYPLGENMPVYGGQAAMGIKTARSVAKGDSSNSYRFSLETHWGTHVDAPRHFFDDGKRIEDYPAETWFFTSPRIIDVSLDASEILGPEEPIKNSGTSTDIILFRSGWTRFRGADKYTHENPGIDPAMGIYLRENHPNLRAIGIDWISVSAYQNRALGRQAHRAFLDPAGKGKPILIVEDMYLPQETTGLRHVIVSPLIVSGVDSAPCTILGVFDD